MYFLYLRYFGCLWSKISFLLFIHLLVFQGLYNSVFCSVIFFLTFCFLKLNLSWVHCAISLWKCWTSCTMPVSIVLWQLALFYHWALCYGSGHCSVSKHCTMAVDTVLSVNIVLLQWALFYQWALCYGSKHYATSLNIAKTDSCVTFYYISSHLLSMLVLHRILYLPKYTSQVKMTFC